MFTNIEKHLLNEISDLECSVCDKRSPRTIRIRVRNNTKLFTVYLTRGIGDPGAYSVSYQQLKSTDDVVIMSENDHPITFTPIAMISFSGSVIDDASSSGHYTSILRSESGNFYSANDNMPPIKTRPENVIKTTIMQLYKRID